MLRGSSRCFDIVLLDHGTYLSITPELRQQFCQLWCSFITGDETVQTDLSGAVAGKRFERLLPAMLTASATNRWFGCSTSSANSSDHQSLTLVLPPGWVSCA